MKLRYVALCLLASLAQASVDSAKEQLATGQETAAAHELQRLANRRDPQAQLYLALLYDLGRGVHQDHVKALYWYGRSAAQGYAPAEFSLGYKYEKGLDLPQDRKAAEKWYTHAAQNGYPRAGERLALLHSRPVAPVVSNPDEE